MAFSARHPASARRPPWRVIERLADNARQDREPWRLE